MQNQTQHGSGLVNWLVSELEKALLRLRVDLGLQDVTDHRVSNLPIHPWPELGGMGLALLIRVFLDHHVRVESVQEVDLADHVQPVYSSHKNRN